MSGPLRFRDGAGELWEVRPYAATFSVMRVGGDPRPVIVEVDQAMLKSLGVEWDGCQLTTRESAP